MCGIVGLHLRDPELYPQLGRLLTGMLDSFAERGPDAAGVAVYGDPRLSPPGHSTVSITDLDQTPAELEAAVARQLTGADGVTVPVSVTTIAEVRVVAAPVDAEPLLAAVRAAVPEALVLGYGRDVTVLKGVGDPRHLTEAWGLSDATGWQGVGHTRMATESAVTASGSHPYSVGADQCLVHNGSFANHATIRRQLQRRGVRFDSENDTEVGARFVARALADGADVETALKQLCAEFDGFYTLLVSNSDSFAVVRDAIACKPAVIAETDAWVAMGSEYRAFVGLPGVERARIYEPEPEQVYAWTR